MKLNEWLEYRTINDVKKRLYNYLYEGSKHFFDEIELEQTIWRGKESKNSLSFKSLQQVNEVFNLELKIENIEGFEKNRILTIHSSALLVRLFFNSVSENKPFKYKGIEYTNRYFEWKNNAINRPSCLDVVLFDNDYKNMLCIESKFSEYLTSNKSESFKKYKEAYEDELKLDIGDSAIENIKQVYAHAYALRNLFTSINLNNENERRKLQDNLENVIYIELVYKFDEIGKNNYSEYEKEYENVISKLSNQIKTNEKEIVVKFEPKLVTYQEIYEYNNDLITEEVIFASILCKKTYSS